VIQSLKKALYQGLSITPSDSLRKQWLSHVRSYPRFQSKPEPGPFDHTEISQHWLRKLGQKQAFLRRQFGICLPTPFPHAINQYKIWSRPGETFLPSLPICLLELDLHETFFDYYPSFYSRSSFILNIPHGSFHGHDHTLFDDQFCLLDWEPPYWALDRGLPGTMFRSRLPRAKNLKGRVLVLSAPAAGGNIWHFLFDSLPKIKLIQEAGISLSEFDHILIDSFKLPYVEESINSLGINRQRVLESEDHPLVTADDLTYVTLGCLLPPDRWVLEWLRSTFLTNGTVKKGTRKIFISRSAASRRRLHREDFIAKRLQDEGFELIALENLSFRQQIKIMSEARAVVSTHGAGLTNLIWYPPGTKIVELFAAEYVNVCYWNISRMLGLDYAYAIGSPTSDGVLSPRAVLDNKRLQADLVFPDIDFLCDKILEFTVSS